MRILHISTRLILGGSQENTVLSCEGQASRGHEVHLAFGPIYGPEGSLLERVERFSETARQRGRETGTQAGRLCHPEGITTHVVPHLVRAVNPWADWRCIGELRVLIRRLKPDIVHTHSSKAGILGRRAAWAVGGCGVVHTIHGPPFMPVQGSAARRAKTTLVNRVYEAAERGAARRCHVIVSVADAMTREFLSRGIGNPEQYRTVYSGMEVGVFVDQVAGQTREEVRAGLGLNPGDLVIGTVARLAEHKGHDDLLDALGDDLRRRREWKLLWVGDGWWRERLMRRVAEMGLKEQVITTGLVPPERVPGLIRAMDILVHPSYREGLPRTVPQALLCGVVPVAYDVDGTGEVCRDMDTGRLVPLGDPGALRVAVEWLAHRPGAREMFVRRGRRECRAKFSAGRMVEELEKVYALALERAERRP